MSCALSVVSVYTIVWYLFNRHSIIRTKVKLLSIGTYLTILHFISDLDVILHVSRVRDDPMIWGGIPQLWTLQWRHNERDGVSNHQHLDCLLNRLFSCRSNKTSKLCVTGLCEGESIGDQWTPLTKGHYRYKKFPFHNVIMDSAGKQRCPLEDCGLPSRGL